MNQKKKRTTHSEKLDLFPVEDKIYGDKEKELQALMFENKSALKKDKAKKYFKRKRDKNL